MPMLQLRMLMKLVCRKPFHFRELTQRQRSIRSHYRRIDVEQGWVPKHPPSPHGSITLVSGPFKTSAIGDDRSLLATSEWQTLLLATIVAERNLLHTSSVTVLSTGPSDNPSQWNYHTSTTDRCVNNQCWNGGTINFQVGKP